MRTEVWLTVTGEQKDPDGRSSQNTTACRAFYEDTGGKHIITYREEDPGSGEVTESEMVISDTSWTITRSGALNAVMRFEKDKEHSCVYDTAFGSIPMKLRAKRMGMRKNGERLLARVSYSLVLAQGEPMECAVTVKAEPLFQGK